MEVTYKDIEFANEQLTSIDIKGKQYMEVNQRIKAFRMIYPQGSIATHIESLENGVVVMSCEVRDEDGRLLSRAYAYEKEDSSFINKTSFIENCCTSATGRALGYVGFGIDTSVASAEEVANAIANQEPTKEDAENYVFEFGKHKGEKLIDLIEDKYIDWLVENSKDLRLLKCIELLSGKKPLTEEETIERDNKLNSKMNYWTVIQELAMKTDTPIEDILNNYKVEHSSDLTEEQMIEAIKILEKKGNK